jgi:hypothetical protein
LSVGSSEQNVSKRPPVRTLYEVRADMRSLAVGRGDVEIDHSRADELLVEAIRVLAQAASADPTLWQREAEELIESWDRVEKWYA